MKKLVIPILTLLFVITLSNPAVTAENSDSPLQLLCIGDESGDTFCGGDISDEQDPERSPDDLEDDDTNYTEKLQYPAALLVIAVFASVLIVIHRKYQK